MSLNSPELCRKCCKNHSRAFKNPYELWQKQTAAGEMISTGIKSPFVKRSLSFASFTGLLTNTCEQTHKYYSSADGNACPSLLALQLFLFRCSFGAFFLM